MDKPMNKLAIQAEGGKTLLVLNGERLGSVVSFSVTQEAGDPFPVISFVMFGDNISVITDGEVHPAQAAGEDGG
jgi:hypothetical protein